MLATSLLEACNNNLEMAVNMHMEGIPGALAADAAPAAAQNMPVSIIASLTSYTEITYIFTI